MAESLKEVIARLKAQEQAKNLPSPPSSPPPKPVEPVAEAEDEEYIEEEDEDIKQPEPRPRSRPKSEATEAPREELTEEQRILMEIEMLQNNGRYRAEQLHQLQEINKALVVIAGILADISGGKNEQRR